MDLSVINGREGDCPLKFFMGTYHIITAQITSFGIQSNKNDVNGVRGPI